MDKTDPKYSSMAGARFNNKEAGVYGARLSMLAAQRGYLTPRIVVEDARNTESPLHSYFDWNDEVAAEAWRIEQAKYLIRNISITVSTDKTPQVRHFFSVTPSANMHVSEPKVYVTMDNVISNAGRRIEVVEYALRELEGWTVRYSQYSELFGVSKEIMKEISKVKKRIGKAKKKPSRKKPAPKDDPKPEKKKGWW